MMVWGREAEKRLGTKSGTATADGRFAIVAVECLGSCGTAPVVQVNRNLYVERATPDYHGASMFHLAAGRDRGASTDSPGPRNPEGVEGYLLPPNGQSRLPFGAI